MPHPKGFIPVVVVIFIALVAATMVGAGLWYKSELDEQPAECQRYFDGCNTCERRENGRVICTDRFCKAEEYEPFRCLDNEGETNQLLANTLNGAKSCIQDSDCTLRVCAGCYNTEALEDAPPDLPCRRYENYTCKCSNSICTEVETRSSTNSNTTIVDTAGWKTYTDTTYGYSVQYPSDWYTEESTSEGGSLATGKQFILKNFDPATTPGRELGGNEAKYVLIVYKNPDGLTPEAYVDQLIDQGYFGTVTLEKDVTVAQKTSRRVESTGLGNILNTFIPGDQHMYDFVGYNNFDLYDEILATFQFTE